VDLTVTAIPFYFGSMAVEHRYLKARAAVEGPTAADYTRPDTLASLSMGVGSIVVPLVTARLVGPFVPGRGRWGKVLVGAAVASTVVTTVADRVARTADADIPPAGVAPDAGSDEASATAEGEPGRRLRRAGRVARKVARVGGVTAFATGGLAVTTALGDRTTPRRMWDKGGRDRDLGAGALGWLAAVAGWDLIYYWNHRFMHEVRALWAIHVVHHSSERYNLSTALRQPVADVLGVWVPYGLLARLGVRPGLISHARGINLLYQYWVHTDTIRRLGPAEEVLNTPSHHRVHHGSNRRYLDRNHGSILIVWDRLFRTFQREEEPVVYGLTKNIETYDPVRIATHEYRDMIRDVADSTTWRERLGFVLRGPGWAHRRRAERATARTGPAEAVPAA
jgi:sterol desaturase/sphingolipid hydroxylase (fatty acid hydroxylase superfamily)